MKTPAWMPRWHGYALAVAIGMAGGSVWAIAPDDPAPDQNAPTRSTSFPVQATEDSLLAEQPPATPCVCPVCGGDKQQTPGFRSCCHGTLLDWSRFPETVHKMPRPGIFPILPKGPGYYSACDLLTDTCRPGPPKSGYAPFAINAWPFFDADWRYVENIRESDRTIVERLKRMHLNDCLMLSTGGEFWMRYVNESNSRLTEANNDFTLTHFRQYADLWYRDLARVYGEFVWADSQGQELAPVPPDVDLGDILNLFVDVNLMDVAGSPLYVRAGRQELLYGSQRLVTPLPWANKRNSFDGVKMFRHGKNWDFDAFWTHFVPPQADEFDSADDNRTFAGLWLTNRPRPGEFRDLYYLYFDNDNAASALGVTRSPFETHTTGTRWSGDRDGFLWDFEGALQFGNRGNNDLFAGMATAGVGKRLSRAAWSPTMWLYYDYASGDDDFTDDTDHTFNQQFPFGHYYLGWMDLVGRQNIHDVNAHLYVYPNKWTTVWLQYHRFWLAENRDALYNAGGVPYRRDPTGAAGSDVGNEIDLVMNFHLSRYSDILVSYNKFFGGSFVESTSGPNAAVDSEALYLIYQQRW
ncbi:alginate export family protein [Roseiconus nitratireducens]|uniref:Alginate export family protein n=1 Tax=Roseiconus nitratireducens TaxID=2605748 RepID=A0A5M6DD97_9BACT|nr:alginate export family protein [Roseiconus nitratireducens]KAA5543155.1 alginate export family protein [Roseiconus nitratireducens]